MITKFRRYRDRIAAEGVQPLTVTEWLLGRAAGRLMVTAATMAAKRRDHASLNSALLSIWAGNRTDGGQALITEVSPKELRQAIKEGRLRLVLDPEAP